MKHTPISRKENCCCHRLFLPQIEHIYWIRNQRITQQRPAAVQSTAAKVVLMRSFFKEPTAVKKTPTAVQSTAVQSTAVKVAPEQVKVILGNRNYDLLFDPKTGNINSFCRIPQSSTVVSC